MAKLRFQVKGEIGNITLRGFLFAVESAFGMLVDYDIAISGESRGSLDWVITNVSTGSLWIETESRSRIEGRNVGPEVASMFVKGWSQIERAGITPPYLSERGMKKAKQLVRLIGREGTTGFLVTDLLDTVEITPQASAHIDQLLNVRQRSIGAVEGRLETISIHGRPRFIIYHSRTRKAVTCVVPADQLAKMIKTDMLGHRVSASGVVNSNIKGEPMRVDAESIRVLRREDELPSTESLGGSDPYFTGDMSTEEYIRSIRSV